jgi:hypothetical protein
MTLDLAQQLEVETLVAHRALDRLGLQLLELGRVLLKPARVLLRQMRAVPLIVRRHLPRRIGRHRHLLLAAARGAACHTSPVVVLKRDEKVLALAADDAATVLGAALALLALVRVEEGEVVVVADLLAHEDVLDGEEGHAVQPAYRPLCRRENTVRLEDISEGKTEDNYKFFSNRAENTVN